MEELWRNVLNLQVRTRQFITRPGDIIDPAQNIIYGLHSF
jgi:hypothetical protein